MTARTLSYLKTNEFTLTGAVGRIVPQNMVDLIDTLGARTPVRTVTFPEYGAIGNGASNPASSVYGTGAPGLAALQAVYGTTVGGVTIAVTNELDWLAIQKSIDAAGANGMVHIPEAIYVMSNANSPGDGSGTVLLPEALPFWPTGTIIDVRGDGNDITVLKWPTDLGSNKFGFLDNNRVTTSTGNAGLVSNVTLQGPAGVYSLANLGTAQSNMSGFGLGAYRHLEDFTAIGFYAGVDVVGGQMKFQRCHLENNYYNFYWSNPSTIMHDDLLIDRCVLNEALQAAVGIHHATSVPHVVWIKCFLGTSPFAFFKETNAGSPTQPLGIFSNVFIQGQFEAIGNALYADDRCTLASGASAAVSSLFDTRFLDSEFVWNATYKNTAYAQGAVVCCSQADNCTFDGGLDQFSPGTQGIFSITVGNAGVTLRGNVNQLIANAVAAGGSANNVFANNDQICARIINTESFPWEGYSGCALTTTVTANQIVNHSATQFNFVSFNAACGGTTADVPAGVVMHIGATAGAFGKSAIIADQGYVTVKSSGTYTATSTQSKWLRTGAAGAAIVASSSNDQATSPIIAILAQAPASTTPATVFAKISGIN